MSIDLTYLTHTDREVIWNNAVIYRVEYDHLTRTAAPVSNELGALLREVLYLPEVKTPQQLCAAVDWLNSQEEHPDASTL